MAFTGIGASRASFANDLRLRVADPNLIDQSDASLCGPAAFMFALASTHPEVYVRCAVELAEKGRTKLGKLDIAPGSSCKSVVLSSTAGIGPVDWVTLASLRDSQNSWFNYDEPSDQAGGVTMPGTLYGWFKDSEVFKDVIDNTNLIANKELSDLVQADARRSAGYTVCLFINAEILTTVGSGSTFPNHWVVLNKEVRIDGSTTMGLSTLGRKVDKDDTQKSKSLDLEVYTWGSRHVMAGGKKVTVEEFLDYFYGYVCAK